MDPNAKGLAKLLQRYQITELFVAGIGLDFGVQNAALQARKLLAQIHNGWDGNFDTYREPKVMIVKQCCAKFGTHSDMSIIRSLEQQQINVISMKGQELERLKQVPEEKLRLYKALDQLTAKANKKRPADTSTNPSRESRRKMRLIFWDLLRFYCVLRLFQLQQKCRHMKQYGEDQERRAPSVFNPDIVGSKLLGKPKRWDNPSEARLKIVRRSVLNMLGVVAEVVDQDANDGGVMTPFHLAVKYNLVEAVRLMLEQTHNQRESKDNQHGSARWEHTRDEFGDTPLIYCIRGLQVRKTR